MRRSGGKPWPSSATTSSYLAVDPGQAHVHVAGAGVLDDVGEELARGREEELLLRMAVVVAEVELEPEAAPARGLLGDGAQGRLEPRLGEHVRV